MEERQIVFSFGARYYKIGNINTGTRQVWIVLHGYGQLAKYFINKFQVLTENNVCVIAPEGLSRFYLSDFTDQGRKDDRVGATWMTKENRLSDIQNYIHYLDAIYALELSASSLPVTILGFSQGSATASRWATQGNIKFERLVLWAGIFPPDIDFRSGHDILTSKKTYLVVGKQDPFLNEARMKEFDQLAKQLNIGPEKIMFDGKHELNDNILRLLSE